MRYCIGDARQVKEHGRHAVGRNAGNIAENNRKHQGGEQRLYEIPKRPEDGLFVLGHNVAAHKQAEQIAVAPHLAEVEIEQRLFRGYDDVPVFHIQWA